MNRKQWKLKVEVALDDLDRHPTRPVPSVSELAKSVGVARQTIWRDSELMGRLNELKQARMATGGKVRRRTGDERVTAMEAENAVLRHANSVLILNFMRIAQKLREHGIDPFMIMGQSARNVAWLEANHLAED